MSRLNERLRDYIRARGIDGKADVCKATKRGMRTVERWASGNIDVPQSLRYDVARQCGCTHEEALAIDQELPEAKGKAS